MQEEGAGQQAAIQRPERQPAQVGETEEEREEREMQSALAFRERWQRKKKHIFVFSNAGKPIFSRYGDESDISDFFGVMQALVSFVIDSDDMIQRLVAGAHQFVFSLQGPLYFVMVAATLEPYAALSRQLRLMHSLIVFHLTGNVARIFEKRAGFDLRHLLGGTDSSVRGLVRNMNNSPAYILNAVQCLPMAKADRTAIGEIMRDAKCERQLFAILIAGDYLVQVVTPQKQPIHPMDLLLLINYVNSTASLRISTNYSPICLPKFQDSGLVYAYIDFIADATTMAGPVGICLILVCTSPDPERFAELDHALPSLSMGNALHGEDVRAQLQVFIQTKARTWNLGGAAGTATSGSDVGDLGAKAVADALKDATHVTHLNLGCNSIGDDGAMALAAVLVANTTVQHVDLHGNSIGVNGAKILANALKNNHTLLHLNLSDNKLGTEGACALAEALNVNSALQFLDLHCTGIGAPGARALSDAIVVNSALRHIDLHWNGLGIEGAVSLAEALEVNSTLQHIDLHYNDIGNDGAEAFAEALEVNYSLSSLNLSGNGIRGHGAEDLATALKVNTSLLEIDLSDNKLGVYGATHLAESLRSNTTLKLLHLSGNDVGDKGVKSLTEILKVNTSLQILFLAENGVTDDGANSVAQSLVVNSTISKLNLSANSIGPDGATVLAGMLVVNSTLDQIDLHSNPIGADGVSVLAEALKVNSTLHRVDLSSCGIGSKGAAALAETLKVNSTLQHVSVRDNNIWADGANSILDAVKLNTTLIQIDIDENDFSTWFATSDVLICALNGMLDQNRLLQEGLRHRAENRWGDGIEAPAAGTRVFFPNGWVLERPVMGAVAVFGYDPTSLQKIQDRGHYIAALLGQGGIQIEAEYAAAIYAYTREDPDVKLYTHCNYACRTAGTIAEEKLTLYRDYLHHLSQALNALPTYSGRAFRGVPFLMPTGCYDPGKRVTWQAFTSTSRNLFTAFGFACNTKTRQLNGSLFVLEVRTGKDVSQLSSFPYEEEVLMGLNSMWLVISCYTVNDSKQKKSLLPQLEKYDLSSLDVYRLQQL